MKFINVCLLTFLVSFLELTRGDRCDSCRRHVRACQVIRREFTNSNLPMGYNYINRIPAGVCNLNITEYGPSSNYIALKTIRGGNILNSQWAITPPGVYHTVGTVFKYARAQNKNCPGECVLALGPTNETIEFQLLTYHTNPGIVYQYQLPGLRWSEPKKENGGRRHGDHRRKHHRRHSHKKPQYNASSRYAALGETQAYTANFRTDDDAKSKNHQHTQFRTSDKMGKASSHRSRHHLHKTTIRPRFPGSEAYASSKKQGNKHGYTDENSRYTGSVETSTSSRTSPRSTSAPSKPHFQLTHRRHRKHQSPSHSRVSQVPSYQPKKHSLRYQALTLSETSDNTGQGHYRAARGHSGQSRFPMAAPYRPSNSSHSSPRHSTSLRSSKGHRSNRNGYNPYRENLHYGPRYPSRASPSGGGDWEGTQPYHPTRKKTQQVSSEYPQLRVREGPKYVSPYDEDLPYGQVQPLTNQQTAYQSVGSPDQRPSYLTSNQALPIDGQSGRTRGGQNQPYLPDANRHIISPDITNTDYSHGGELRTVHYTWRIRGFTNCSRECGGGVQETEIICVKGISEAVVTEDNCEARLKPTPQEVQCNLKPCPPQWETGEWLSCSVTCGSGLQRRRVECKKRVSADLQISVSARRCSILAKPSIVQQCRSAPCARWKKEEWGKCSVSCGKGERRRRVACVDGTDNPVPEIHCKDGRPSTVETCHRGSCSRHWYYTDWSDSCSTDCGAGVATRQVICLSKDGNVLKSKRCENQNKPQLQRSCDSHRVCGGQWFVGPWKKCSTSCGKGLTTREVICMKSENDGPSQPISDDKCDQTDRPLTEKSCDGAECGVQWYMTDWSACSVTCGTGHQTREIKCLDNDQEVSSQCDREEKPESRKGCSQPACKVDTETVDESCQDQLTNCIVVAQARLCRYKFYKSVCCKTCSKSHH